MATLAEKIATRPLGAGIIVSTEKQRWDTEIFLIFRWVLQDSCIVFREYFIAI